MVRAHLSCQHEASAPPLTERGMCTSGLVITPELLKLFNGQAAEIAFTPLVLGLSVRDEARPDGFFTLPDEQSGHHAEELNEASGVSAVFHGCSVSFCAGSNLTWEQVICQTWMVESWKSSQSDCQQRDLKHTDATRDVVILRDWDLLAVLL